MNKEYIYLDGKVIISDEKNNKIQSEYYDNLDEVLVQENLIEQMREQIKKLEKESHRCKKNHNKRYIPKCMITMSLLAVIGLPIIFNLFTPEANTVMVNSIFGLINQNLLTCIPFSTMAIAFGAMMEVSEYKEYKKNLNKENGINSELEFLKKKIEVEKENLKKLIKEKPIKNEKVDFRIVDVDDSKQLETLKQYSKLYFNLGYNGEKYYQYYQEGNLEKELENNYNEEEIRLVKEYIEEKGPSLILKRKKKK